MDARDPIMLVLPRAEIKALKFKPFLRRFGSKALPKGAELAALMGRFNFMVHGYDDDPQEVYVIEEVRAFYRKLWKEWPYWLFFCDLRTEGLMMMTLCCLNQLSGAKILGEPAAKVMIDPLELIRFISDGFPPMNEMFERAGASEMAVYRRTKAVMEYYKMPFDEPPPG
jgi:hypothetical protein